MFSFRFQLSFVLFNYYSQQHTQKISVHVQSVTTSESLSLNSSFDSRIFDLFLVWIILISIWLSIRTKIHAVPKLHFSRIKKKKYLVFDFIQRWHKFSKFFCCKYAHIQLILMNMCCTKIFQALFGCCFHRRDDHRVCKFLAQRRTFIFDWYT